MNLTPIICFFFLIAAVTSLPAETERADAAEQFLKCVFNAYQTDTDLMKHIKDCFAAGGDVMACVKSIHALVPCFPQ